ncbi:MAG: dTDP-4-dehydrorhamnose reductase [Bryobacter sp.]|nr:dTDP-4-dehydrorhamnose reductase [Bryobacter sp.]
MEQAFVFGAEGQLGVELVRVLETRGYTVRGFSRRSADITDENVLATLLSSEEPRYVFNAAAYNKVDVAESEPQAAYAANALAVRNLANACRQNDATLVHFSTDYVFDGELGRAYTESDAVCPVSAYGISKLAGEYFAQAYCDRALVLRTSGVFGPQGTKTANGNFVETMLRLATKGTPIRVVADYVASPTYSPELARFAVDLAEAGQTGVFHAGGGEAASWFDYAKLIFARAGLSPELSPADPREYRTIARRPRYSALANARATALGIAPFPPLAEQVDRYFTARAALLES